MTQVHTVTTWTSARVQVERLFLFKKIENYVQLSGFSLAIANVRNRSTIHTYERRKSSVAAMDLPVFRSIFLDVQQEIDLLVSIQSLL